MVFADLTTGILTLMNLAGVCAKSREIRVQTGQYLKQHGMRESRVHKTRRFSIANKIFSKSKN